MQVSWETITAIASTKAIDLWYLFPLGVAVNRLLKKDGNIDELMKQKLDHLFGETDWQNAFYEVVTMNKLFGEESGVTKIANFDLISRYFVQRLKTIFPGVAENPLPLRNSKK
jgi:three-Cys-motif partner protein